MLREMILDQAGTGTAVIEIITEKNKYGDGYTVRFERLNEVDAAAEKRPPIYLSYQSTSIFQERAHPTLDKQ